MSKLFSMITAAWVLTCGAYSGFAQTKLHGAQEEAKKALESRADSGPGVRLGYGLNPEQYVIGARFSTDPRKMPRIVVSVDLGFGDDQTTVACNFDLLWRLRVEGSRQLLYGGAGPALVYFNPSGDAGASWKTGLSVIAGIRLSPNDKRPISLEARVASGQIPDFKLLVVIGL